MDLERVKRMSDEIALYITKRFADEQMPMADGMTTMAMAIGNILQTTAVANPNYGNDKRLCEEFKKGLDMYFEV